MTLRVLTEQWVLWTPVINGSIYQLEWILTPVNMLPNRKAQNETQICFRVLFIFQTRAKKQRTFSKNVTCLQRGERERKKDITCMCTEESNKCNEKVRRENQTN